MWKGNLRTLTGSASLVFKGKGIRKGEIKDRQHHLGYKGSGTGTAHTCGVKNKTRIWQHQKIPCPRHKRKGRAVSYLERFNYSTSQAREAATAATLGEVKVSPDSSSGCSLLTRNHKSVTVGTRNQNNHFRTGRKLQQADAHATGTQPSRVHPGAGSKACWEMESGGGPAQFTGGNGSGLLPSTRFRPILAALREPTNGCLEVSPREGFTNILEGEAANLWVKCSCATGLQA